MTNNGNDIGDRQVRKKLIIQAAVLLAVCIIAAAGGRLLSGNRFKMTVGLSEISGITSPEDVQIMWQRSDGTEQGEMISGSGEPVVEKLEVIGPDKLLIVLCPDEPGDHAGGEVNEHISEYGFLQKTDRRLIKSQRWIRAIRRRGCRQRQSRQPQYYFCHHELSRLQERCMGENCRALCRGTRQQNQVVVLAECLCKGVRRTAGQSHSAGNCMAGHTGSTVRKYSDSDCVETTEWLQHC